MFIDPASLAADLDRLEDIEKASLRLVTHAIYEFRQTAADIFAKERDLAQDIAEDISREALDRLGVSRMDLRLYGKIDYKKARYLFQPEYAVRQALLVDTKAEKDASTATIQTAQTSMRIRHIRAGQIVDEAGELPVVLLTDPGPCLSTTIFVKYEYADIPSPHLLGITVAALPNGMLQDRYNPDAARTIWRAGRNAPTRGEPFRVRLVFDALKAAAGWRVQYIPLHPKPFAWSDQTRGRQNFGSA